MHTIAALDASSNAAFAQFTVTVPPASITLSPSSGQPGSQVAVAGTGFAASSAITIKFDTTTLLTDPLSVTTDATGGFSAKIVVPLLTTNGPHTVTAQDASSNSASAQLNVIAPAVANPTLTVRSIDMSGNTITGLWTTLSRNGATVSTGFTPKVFTLTANQPYLVGMGNFGATKFDHWLDTGSTVQPRPVTINANSILTAVYRTGAVATPSISLSPSSGMQGTATVVTVTGSNFLANTNIVFKLDGNIITPTSGTPTTTSTGAFPSGLKITIPSSAAVGSHSVSASTTAGTSTRSASTQFTVNPAPAPTPAISLNPSSAQSGTTTVVTISGTGFAANTTIVVRYDNNIVSTYPIGSTIITSITTSGSGTFSARFTVTSAMSATTGDHIVRATAGTTSTTPNSTNSATATFKVTAPPSTTTSTLTIRSVNTNGGTITGMWTFLQRNGANVDTGFTPKTFTLTNGVQYTVGVGNYGRTVFDHWQDNGSTSPTRPVTINSNTSLVAVYRVG